MQTIKATVKNSWSDSLSLIHMRVRVVTHAHGGVACPCMIIQGVWFGLVKSIPVGFCHVSVKQRKSRLLSVINSLSMSPCGLGIGWRQSNFEMWIWTGWGALVRGRRQATHSCKLW